MKSENSKLSAVLFWTVEAVLMVVFTASSRIMIGYKTIALALLAITFLAALYRLISVIAKKNAKAAKVLKSILTSLVCLGLAFFAVIEVLVISAAHTDKDAEAPYLVVLGAGVNETVPSLALEYRLEAAKAYLDEYSESTAIVSGGQGEGESISEAECMRSWLVKNGISADRIIMEEKSTSTYENLKNSLEIVRNSGGDPEGKIAVLSGEYHLYRATYMARKLGADAIGVAAHTGLPILKANYFIREAFGVAVMWLT